MDKINHPTTELLLTLQSQGVYNVPEDWRLADEANPGQFKYTLNYLDFSVEGEFQHKVLTLKEQIKQQTAKGVKRKEDPAQDEYSFYPEFKFKKKMRRRLSISKIKTT